MLSSFDVRRAGLLLRAIAESSTWTSGVSVSTAEIAKTKGIVATEQELAEMSGYLVDQGWLAVEKREALPGHDRHAITRHGFDESQRKLAREPKPWTRGDS
jgi:hypothetical protein